MKKYIMVFFLTFFIMNSAIALDINKIKEATISTTKQIAGINANTNIKQNEAERKLREETFTKNYYLKNRIILIQEDKLVYDEGGESIYGELVKIKNKYTNINDINYEYSIKAENLYKLLLKQTPEKCISAEEFDKLKIIINDNDFDKIDENLKKIILSLNIY